MSLLTDFKQAQLDIRTNRTVIIGHRQRLELHGFYAQAELGDNTQPEPKKDMVIWHQKWLEHNKHKGMEKEEAMRNYIELTAKILKKKVSKPKALPPLSYQPQTRLATFRSNAPVVSSPKQKMKAEALPKPETSINSSLVDIGELSPS